MKTDNKIKDLKAKSLGNNMLVFSGPDESLERLCKKLTITNKSVGYRLNMVKKDLLAYSKRTDRFAIERVSALKTELKELNEKIVTEYYEKLDNGDVAAPAGFWYLADEITDKSHLNTEIRPFALKILRDYQKEAIAALLKYKRSTCVLATGLGKTLTITSLALSAVKAGKRTIIIVPTQDLVEQFVGDVKPFHQSVTGAHGSKIPKLGCDILVCTVGTAQKYIDNFDVIVIDESHHSPAETWASLLASCEKAEYVYNFTATPFRSDGLDLAIHAFGGPVVYERDLIWGIQNNWLEHFDVYRIKINAIEKGQTVIVSSSKQHTTAYKKIVSNKSFLQELAKVLGKAFSNNRKMMVLFKTLAGAKELAKICKKAIGFSVADAKWKKPLKDFQQGKTSILVATSKLVGEGINIPDADTLILCVQNSSDVITYQALGRILRKKEGKKKPIVIDIIANGYTPYEGSAKARLKIWRKAADSVTDLF